jgi:hypothetical protein
MNEAVGHIEVCNVEIQSILEGRSKLCCDVL